MAKYSIAVLSVFVLVLASMSRDSGVQAFPWNPLGMMSPGIPWGTNAGVATSPLGAGGTSAEDAEEQQQEASVARASSPGGVSAEEVEEQEEAAGGVGGLMGGLENDGSFLQAIRMWLGMMRGSGGLVPFQPMPQQMPPAPILMQSAPIMPPMPQQMPPAPILMQPAPFIPPMTQQQPNIPVVLPDSNLPANDAGQGPALPQASATSQSEPGPEPGPEPAPEPETTPETSTEVIDLSMEVDDDVRPAGGFALKMWLCDQQDGVCAYQCENPSDAIPSVDCGSGPKGKLYCCDE